MPHGGTEPRISSPAATDAFLHDLSRHWDGKRVLLIAHSGNRWALDCLLKGATLHEVVTGPFVWQAGWQYALPADWPAPPP